MQSMKINIGEISLAVTFYYEAPQAQTHDCPAQGAYIEIDRVYYDSTDVTSLISELGAMDRVDDAILAEIARNNK